MKNNYLIGNILLFITSIIWGCAYVAQSSGMTYIGPFAFNSVRCFIACTFSFVLYTIFKSVRKERPDYKKPTKNDVFYLIKAGICCGLILTMATLTQQYGISLTTVGKAGFLSVLYIIYVPFIQLLFHIKLPKAIWISVILAIIGMYFLCMDEKLSISIGDIIVIISSMFFGLHILVIGYFAPKTDGIALSTIQFFVCALISFVLMLIFDKPHVNNVLKAWIPLVYAGAISGGVGYTLQIIGQKWSSPSIASLILSLESVFAVIAGIIFLKEIPTMRQVLGCALMFIAIILVQLRQGKE